MRFAITLLALWALTNSPALAGDGQLWTVTTDYSTFGGLHPVAGAQPWTVSSGVGTVPGDAIARHHDGLLYVVGRGGANLVQIYDPGDNLALVREFSLGAGLNPQDVVFGAGGAAYVSCYDAAVLLKVDMDAGTVLQTFSTGAYADSDGLPETAWMLAHGSRIYITCQLLDRNNWYAPTGPGKLLVFDTETDSWLPAIDLVLSNPYSQLRVLPGNEDSSSLAVGCAGYWGVLDGGVETVDLVTGLSTGVLIHEADLAGDVLHMTFAGSDKLFALISTTAFTTNLVSVSWPGPLVAVLDVGTGFDHADLAFDGDFQIFVADRKTGAAGIRVFDAGSGTELTTTPLATTLPPFFLVLSEAPDTAPVPLAFNRGLDMGMPYPNPCNPRARVRLSGHPDTPLQVSVYDARGLRVQETRLSCDDQGEAEFVFAGQDRSGLPLAAGLYRVVGRQGNQWAARSVMLVK
jgi:hypothetical protein